MDNVNTVQNVDLLVPRERVKQVKSALERCKLLDRSRKIQHSSTAEDRHVIPTNFEVPNDAREWLLDEELEHEGARKIEVLVRQTDGPHGRTFKATNGLRDVVQQWLTTLEPAIPRLEIDELVRAVPTGYSIYEPMLLLPSSTFNSPLWQQTLENASAIQLAKLWTSLATTFSVSHIAINAPIPLSNGSFTTERQSSTHPHGDTTVVTTLNVLRSPSGLHPFYGDFGPSIPSSDAPPTKADYDAAFWVSTRQNGITQVWAPRYTMFSRGNIKEKARILSLPLLRDSGISSAAHLSDDTVAGAGAGTGTSGGSDSGSGSARCTAVDMYAGIGYFAFSYVKAGADLVLGFEMNGWSVEGLRRGALRNGWTALVVRDRCNDFDTTWLERPADELPKLVVYQMDNRYALDIVRRIKDQIPPVRHVNLGLLPSSRASWAAAVDMIDDEIGGWIHVHENFRTDYIPELAEDVRKQVQVLYDARFSRTKSEAQVVLLEHVERVKTYAPGVMHCVLDIYLPGQGTQ